MEIMIEKVLYLFGSAIAMGVVMGAFVGIIESAIFIIRKGVN